MQSLAKLCENISKNFYKGLSKGFPKGLSKGFSKGLSKGFSKGLSKGFPKGLELQSNLCQKAIDTGQKGFSERFDSN